MNQDSAGLGRTSSAGTGKDLTQCQRRRSPNLLSRAAAGGKVSGGAAGLLGASANLLFLAATGSGRLTISAVLAGRYPAVTVTLAAVLLHERMNRTQQGGLLAAATSIILLTTGS